MIKRLRDERGVAMVVATSMLMVVSLLAAAAATTSVRSSDNANGDRNAKRALAAAEAGLQTAAYRLKKLNPPTAMCMTTTSTGVAPVGGECPSTSPEKAGTDATFTYVVTQAGATCGQLPGTTPKTGERCITATGTVKGVSRRIQARVELGPSTPWAQAGIVGSEWVTLTNDINIDATDVGTNGVLTMTGTPTLVELRNGAVARPYAYGGSVVRTGTTTISGGIVNSPYAFTMPQVNPEPSRLSNNNAWLAANYPTYFNAATRTLNIPTGGTVLLPAGTYNFCKWTMAPGAKLDMNPATAASDIFIDSPLRAGSGCNNAGDGKFIGNGLSGRDNEVKINNGRFDANVTVWVYGTTSNASATDVEFSWGHIDAVWYVPNSIFYAHDKVTMHGGVAGIKIRMTNDVHAKLDTAVKSKPGPGIGAVSRRGWFECKSAPTTPSDPESGC